MNAAVNMVSMDVPLVDLRLIRRRFVDTLDAVTWALIVKSYESQDASLELAEGLGFDLGYEDDRHYPEFMRRVSAFHVGVDAICAPDNINERIAFVEALFAGYSRMLLAGMVAALDPRFVATHPKDQFDLATRWGLNASVGWGGAVENCLNGSPLTVFPPEERGRFWKDHADWLAQGL